MNQPFVLLDIKEIVREQYSSDELKITLSCKVINSITYLIYKSSITV